GRVYLSRRTVIGKRTGLPMNRAESYEFVSLVIFLLAGFNAVLAFGNGLFMLWSPESWYYDVPGVTDTGFFNQHFIRDIGIIYLLNGIAFGMGIIRPARRAELWGFATLWLVCHAVFHLWEVAVGICSPSTVPRDFWAVILPALNGIAATVWALRT